MELFGKNYLSTKEASRKYGYSESWFFLRRQKKIPPKYVRMGGKVYYDETLLDQWFKELIEYC